MAAAVGTLAVAGCGSSTKTVSGTGANGQVTTQTVPDTHFAELSPDLLRPLTNKVDGLSSKLTALVGGQKTDQSNPAVRRQRLRRHRRTRLRQRRPWSRVKDISSSLHQRSTGMALLLGIRARPAWHRIGCVAARQTGN